MTKTFQGTLGRANVSFTRFIGIFVIVGILVFLLPFGPSRHDELRSEAEKLNLSFWTGQDKEFSKQFSELFLFNQGEHRTVEVKLTDRQNKVTVFDYFYETSFRAGEHTTRHRYDYRGVVQELRSAFPTLSIRKRGAFERKDDESLVLGNADFQKRFHVTCKDPHFADAFLSAEMVDLILKWDPDYLAIQGNQLIVYELGKMRAHLISDFLEMQAEFRLAMDYYSY